jgi:hypothetical protein
MKIFFALFADNRLNNIQTTLLLVIFSAKVAKKILS